MAKKRYSIIEAINNGALETVISTRQPELLILRGHGLIEAALLTLLATRLAVDESDLPVFGSFDSLARIALSGAKYSYLQPAILHVNRMRNIIAHELAPRDAEELMRELISTMPHSLAEASKRHGVATVEIFAASLMVLLYVLLSSGATDFADAPIERPDEV